MNDLYGFLFQELLHPAWESAVRRRPTLAHLGRLERTQWCSADELAALQGVELRRLLEHAYRHVPDIRRRFERAGIAPADVRTSDDLPKLPLLTREEATRDFEERKSCVPPLPVIGKMTSGTTGVPLVFAYDAGSEHWRNATKLRGYGWAGYRPGDRSLHFWGTSLVPQRRALRLKKALDHALHREHYVDCTERSEEALSNVVGVIKKLRPSVIVCYAQAGAALSRHVLENDSRDWDCIRVICAAERLFPTDREVIEQAFGSHVFETYGSREVMLMAAECEAHDGMHVSMENLIVEVIVREAGRERPARPGEVGEVVVTDLHNYGAPFIRYLTGDLAVPGSRERCACGRSLGRLATVEGRATDTLRDGAGRPVSGLFFNVLFASLAHKIRQFQVIQRKDRAIDLKLVPASSFDDALLETVRRNCAKHLPGVELRTELVPELLAEQSGKLRVVVVEG